MGAPIGNKNRSNAKRFEDAIARALSRKGGDLRKGLDLVSDQLVAAAVNGESWAIKEIADRIDGKPKQITESTHTMDLPENVKIVLVEPNAG